MEAVDWAEVTIYAGSMSELRLFRVWRLSQ